MNKEIFQKYNIRAKKTLGQNFLINDDIIQKIADTLKITGKNIVEVGPGYGALTQKLIEKKPKSLNLVELDNDMIDILEKRIENKDFDLEGIDFKINNIDVLKYEPENFKVDSNTTSPQPSPSQEREQEEYKYSLIANIPYYITSPILRHFLYDIKNKPTNMLILMQKDVGDKIIKTSPPTPLLTGDGNNNKNKLRSSVLGLFIAKKATVNEIITVRKEDFIPSPKVESSVLLFELHDEFSHVDDDKFLEIIKIGFKEPRKMLLKNLSSSGFDKDYLKKIFLELNIDEKVRAEDLDINIWSQLTLKINI